MPIGALGMMAANAIGGTILGIGNDQRQHKQNERNTRTQVKAQKELTDYNQAKALEMWKATGYGAQKAQMKEAGINPALMYGMGGGGGQSASVTPGSVGQGASPSSGGETLGAMGMGLQMALMKAQKENIEADTANKLGDAANKPIVGKNLEADTGLKWAGVSNTEARTKLTEIEQRTAAMAAQVAEDSVYEATATVRYNMQRTQEEVNKLLVANRISRASQEEIIKSFKLQNAETLANIGLKAAQTSNTNQMTEESKAKVLQWVNENVMRARGLEYEGRRTTVAELEQSVDRDFKEALIKAGEWHNFIQGMNGVINLGIPQGPGKGVGKPF